MRNKIISLTSVCFLLFQCCLNAQSIVVEMGPDDKGRPLPATSKNSKKEENIFQNGVWNAYDNFKLLKSPLKNSEPSGFPPMKYMEHFDVSWEYQGEDQVYYLLCQGEGDDFRNFGWIPSTYVSFFQAQKNRNNIFKKALVINPIDQITKQRKVEPIPVRLAPDQNAKTVDPLRLYNIYSIFSDTHPGDPKNGYCLLGSDFGFDDDDPKTKPEIAAATIKGWIPKEFICLWDTREALEWDVPSTMSTRGEFRRTTPVKVFKTREEALKDAKGQKVEPWFVENLQSNGESIPMKYFSQRYPVIPMKKDEEITLPKVGRLYKIGAIGGFVDENGNEIASKDEIEKLRKKLEDIQGEVDSTDIVFVIDDTESMRDYFLAAAESVEKILEAIKREKGKVRIGLVFYNDIAFAERNDPKNLDKAIDVNQLVDIAGPEGQKIIQKLKEHKTTRGGDPREQMFHGLKKALESVGFSNQSRKIAILIGDTGDHDTNLNGAFAKEKSIVDRMVFEDRSPVEFFGIQVVPPKGDPDLNAFKEQVTKIIQLSHAKMESFVVRDSEGKVTGNQKDGRENLYVQISDVDEVIKQILNRYKQLREKSAATAAEIANIKGGQWTRVSPEVERILQQENVNIDFLRKSKGLQVFDYGWVWEKGKPANCSCNQVRLKMLTEEYDRLQLERLLYDIENASPGRRPKPEQIAKILNNAGTGEKNQQEEKLAESRLKSLGLVAQSPLLKKTLAEAKETKEDESFQAELNKLFIKRRLLNDIHKHEKSEYSITEQSDGENGTIKMISRKGEPTKEQRLFRPPGSKVNSTQWVWLDFEDEWP